MAVVISAVEGNRQLLDGGAMFGNAPRAVWERWIKPDELGRIPLACRCLLVEFGDLTVLCEAGIGAFFEPRLAHRYGVEEPDRHLLLENLAALGVSPARIDYVILSHLHFDHAGGLLPTYRERAAGRDGLVFPRARFVVGSEAWARAQTPHARDRASFVPELNRMLAESGRLDILGPGEVPPALAGRLEILTSEGHTPGQIHALIKGDHGRVFYCGDLVPGLPWVHLPITMGYDRFPERLIDEKTEVFARAAREDWRMFFTHDPRHAAARVRATDAGSYAATEVQDAFARVAL